MPSVITPCGGGGGGIQFDTYPQTGDWLHIDTTSSREGVPNGSGIKLTAVDNIDINTLNSISLLDTGGGGIYLTSTAGVTGGSFIGIQAEEEVFVGGDSIVLQSTGHNIEIHGSLGTWVVFDYDGGASFQIGSGKFFAVDLSAGGTFLIAGLPIVNPGGSGRVWNNGGVLNIT